MSEIDDRQGAPWSQDEIDLIVADYFAMRTKFLRGEAFVKKRHYTEVYCQTGRSIGSVQHKYMNISAALQRVSLPWVKGFAPQHNLQAALREAVEKFVADEWTNDFTELEPMQHLAESPEIFLEPPPTVLEPLTSANGELERIARKFDPALRDERNRKLGAAGEELVFKSQITHLTRLGRPDLAQKVRWVAKEDGDGAGYDILSFSQSGEERFLEVKTTVGHNRTPFFLTRNEKDFGEEESERFRIFRLYDWGQSPRAFKIKPPFESKLTLEPTVYKASFREPPP